MMTSLSGTVSRMLREVMFASGVWYCVLLGVFQAVSALATSLAVMVCHFRARKKSILSTQLFFRFLDRLPVQPCNASEKAFTM